MLRLLAMWSAADASSAAGHQDGRRAGPFFRVGGCAKGPKAAIHYLCAAAPVSIHLHTYSTVGRDMHIFGLARGRTAS